MLLLICRRLHKTLKELALWFSVELILHFLFTQRKGHGQSLRSFRALSHCFTTGLRLAHTNSFTVMRYTRTGKITPASKTVRMVFGVQRNLYSKFSRICPHCSTNLFSRTGRSPDMFVRLFCVSHDLLFFSFVPWHVRRGFCPRHFVSS